MANKAVEGMAPRRRVAIPSPLTFADNTMITNILAVTSQYAPLVRDAVVTVSAASAAIVAYQGLTAWRRELRGKTEYELARRVIRATYKVRDAFRHVRNPAIFVYEYPSDPKETGRPTTEAKDSPHKVESHVYEERWRVLSDAMRELEAEGLEAQVLWGQEFEKAIKPFRMCRVKLQIALRNHLLGLEGKDMYRGRDEMRERDDNVMYYTSDNPSEDAFSGETQQAIDGIEKLIRPHLRK